MKNRYVMIEKQKLGLLKSKLCDAYITISNLMDEYQVDLIGRDREQSGESVQLDVREPENSPLEIF